MTDQSTPYGKTLRVTCPSVPLQIEGAVDGGYIYFRARHGHWQLGIGRSQDEAVNAAFDAAEPVAFRGVDADEDMSFGGQDEAWALLAEYLPRLRLA